MSPDVLRYNTFNARNYTAAQVAETFVPNDDFEELWTNNHTVLLGPRGSGKTTLLKMLTLQALDSWKHPRAADLKASSPFVAVYTRHARSFVALPHIVISFNPSADAIVRVRSVTLSLRSRSR